MLKGKGKCQEMIWAPIYFAQVEVLKTFKAWNVGSLIFSNLTRHVKWVYLLVSDRQIDVILIQPSTTQITSKTRDNIITYSGKLPSVVSMYKFIYHNTRITIEVVNYMYQKRYL